MSGRVDTPNLPAPVDHAADRDTGRRACLCCNQPTPPARVCRGLCTTCYQRVRNHGHLDDYPATYRHWAEYADDYVMLRAEGYPLDVIAARLTMTCNALSHALWRHKSDPRARRPGDTHDHPSNPTPGATHDHHPR